MYDSKVLMWISAFLGLVSGALGGFDYLLVCLISMIVIDFVMGFISAAVFNTSKYSNNGVTSDALFKGAIRKICILGLVCCAVIIDRALTLDYVRNAVCLYFIATEGISVMEHLVHIGVPVPKFVIRILESVKEEKENADV